MYSLLSFAFSLVVILWVIIWFDIRKNNRYGSRRKYVLLSGLPLILLCGLAFFLSANKKDIDPEQIKAAFMLLSAGFYAAICLLEHSIHIQRIIKGHLYDDFKKKLKIYYIFVSVIILTVIYAFLTILSVNPIKLSYHVITAIHFISITVICIYSILSLYNYVQGSLRFKKNPYVFLIIISFIVTIIEFFGTLSDKVIFVYFILLFIYTIRLVGEYIYYKSFHLDNLLATQIENQYKRTNLINKVIESSFEQDVIHLKDMLIHSLNDIEKNLVISEYKISGLVLYRKTGDKFKVSSDQLIYGYAPPLYELESIRQQKQDGLKKYVLSYEYDADKLKNTEAESLRHFGQKAIKKVIETLKPVTVEDIPACYRGLVSYIVIYPIVNTDKLSGFMVIYKKGFNQLLPYELKTLEELSINFNTVFSIMRGKESQREQNRLQGEMNIAKEIQTSIVPSVLDIPGYETACSMTTASEVGGDMYDYMPAKFGNYISIGDVSGHGLPSGIMALINMASFQGAIETAEELGKKVEVHQLYDIVNRVLCRINRDRIGSDKFMTANIMLEENGRIVHAGTHEIALVYRKSTKNIEKLNDCVDKTAFLGLTDQLKSKSSQSSFKMNKGDILLLYTDGTIEAKNEDSVQFGIDQLEKTLINNCERDIDDVRQAILDAVAHHSRNGDLKKLNGNYYDDITLVLMKKK